MKYLIIIKKIVYFISFIAVILSMGFGFSDAICGIIFAISVILGFILSFITICKAGTPYNRLHRGRFLFFDNRDLSCDKWIIYVKEKKNGVWEVGDRYKTILDMSGWWRQKKYIAELISLKFVLEVYNNKKQIALSLPFGSQQHRIDNLTVCFIDIMGRRSQYKIIKNNICYKSLYMRYRLFCGTRSIISGPSRWKGGWKYDKAEIFDFYRLKRDQLC